MPGVPFLLPLEFDLVATFLAALTGVWAASRRGYDLVGACTLAFVSGAGGGLLRDAVFLGQIPVVMQHGEYLWAVLLAVVLGVATYRYAQRFERLFAYADALATGAYGVYGANRSLIAGLSPEGAVLVGLCNAVGGGLLRDVIAREEPLLLKPGQLYAIAALAGCFVFVVLSYKYGLEDQQAAWIAILVTALLRILAIQFNWTTSALGRKWRGGDGPKPD